MKEFLDLLTWLAAADAGVLRWLLLILGGYIAMLQRAAVRESKQANANFLRFAAELTDLNIKVNRIDTWKDMHEEKDDDRHEETRMNFHDVRDKIHGLALLPLVTQSNSRKGN